MQVSRAATHHPNGKGTRFQREDLDRRVTEHSLTDKLFRVTTLRITSTTTVAMVITASVMTNPLITPPAMATSQTLQYNCEVPTLGLTRFTVIARTGVTPHANTGSTVPLGDFTAIVGVPDSVTSLLTGPLVGAESVDATSDITIGVDGDDVTFTATSPRTTLPRGGELKLPASGPIPDHVFKSTGQKSIVAKDFTSTLSVWMPDGSLSEVHVVPCEFASNQNGTVNEVNVIAAGKPLPENNAPESGPLELGRSPRESTPLWKLQAAMGGGIAVVVMGLMSIFLIGWRDRRRQTGSRSRRTATPSKSADDDPGSPSVSQTPQRRRGDKKSPNEHDHGSDPQAVDNNTSRVDTGEIAIVISAAAAGHASVTSRSMRRK